MVRNVELDISFLGEIFHVLTLLIHHILSLQCIWGGGVYTQIQLLNVILWILAQIDEEIDGAVEDYEDV